ncbi:MAG: sigma-E processing peptidase SpoIIGA [Oscillospiraceae bacterium]
MTVVYLDRVFLLNSVVDYLLFLCAARLCGFPPHRRRLIFCAVLGGVTRLRSLFPSLHFWLTRRSDWPLGLLALAAFRRFRPVLTFFAFGRPRRHPAGPRPGLWLGGGTGTAVVLRRC